MTLTIWLIFGVIFFFLARAALQLEFGCNPITIKTILGMLIVMWVPPLSLLAAFGWFLLWAIENKKISFLDKEIVNPCKWFSK